MSFYEIASTSPEALHHGDTIAATWHSHGLTERFAEAANEIQYGIQKLLVTETHTIESIADFFGIHTFHHNITNKNLLGCHITLHPHGILEIERPDQKHSTTFPVIRRQQLLAA